MREMLKLLVTVAVFSTFSGGLLAAVRIGTRDRIEYQKVKFVKGPTIKQILKGCSNDPLVDRFKILDGKNERNFYVGEFDGKRDVVAFESFGKGFGGDIGIMVAINLENDKIVGVGVTTHSESPGLGARAKTDPTFVTQFKGLPIEKEPFKVKADGGQIDALSGATVTSRGVCKTVSAATETYKRLKAQILKNLKS